jgi:signal transduction histidine kinase
LLSVFRFVLIQVSGLRSQVSAFAFRFQVSGFSFQVYFCFRSQLSGLDLRFPIFLLIQLSGFKFQVLFYCFRFQLSVFVLLVSVSAFVLQFSLSSFPISALIQVPWAVSKHDDWRPDSGCLPDRNWNLLQFIFAKTAKGGSMLCVSLISAFSLFRFCFADSSFSFQVSGFDFQFQLSGLKFQV